MLSDEELQEALDASGCLVKQIRSTGQVNKKKPVVAKTFRQWFRTTALSDRTLPTLAELFLECTAKHGEGVARREGQVPPPGVRALAALSTTGHDEKVFAARLDEIRSGKDVDAASDESTSHDLMTLEQVDEALSVLREKAEETIAAIDRARKQVAGGLAVDDGDVHAIDEWQATRWRWVESLGFSKDGAAPVGFEALTDMRDGLLLAQQEQDRQLALEDELQTLQASLPTLENLESHDETYAMAAARTRERIAEITDKLVQEEPSEELISADRSENDTAATDPPPSETAIVAEPADATSVELNSDSVEIDASAAELENTRPEPDAEAELEPEVEVTTELGAVDAMSAEQDPIGDDDDSVFDSQATPLIEPIELEAEVDKPTETETDTGTTDDQESTTSALAFDSVAANLEATIRAGHLGAAWAIAAAAGLPPADVDAYRLAAAAFHSMPGRLEPSEVLRQFLTELDRNFTNRDAARVALAAVLRVGLPEGWVPRSELTPVLSAAGLSTEWDELYKVAGDTGAYAPQRAVDTANAPTTASVQRRAERQRDALSKQHISFTRADNVRRHLLRSDMPLGGAFDAVAADTSGETRRNALAAAKAVLVDTNAVISVADKQVSSKQQLRTPIIATARDKLEQIISTVRSVLAEAIEAASAADVNSHATTGRHADLTEAARAARSSQDTLGDGPGAAALERLVSWILAPEPLAQVYRTTEEVLAYDTLAAVDAVRDSDGVPVLAAMPEADRVKVIADLFAQDQVPASQLVSKYIERGDLRSAALAAGEDGKLIDAVDDERPVWSGKLARRVAAARGEIGRAFANDYTQRAQSAAEARLVGPSKYSGDRFDLQLAELDSLLQDLADHRAATGADLRTKIDELPSAVSDDDRAIIRSRVDADDFIGAHELLAMARSGDRLPDVDAQADGAGMFDRFSRIATALPAGANVDTVLAAFTEDGTHPVSETIYAELKAWEHIFDRKQAAKVERSWMESALRSIGLELSGELGAKQKIASRGRVYRIAGKPVDGSLVPMLGTQTSHYVVAVTQDSATLTAILESFKPGMGPNIVLVCGTLSEEDRRRNLNTCRKGQIAALVIDYAVAAFVATTAPRSFKVAQQVALPYTCFGHYGQASGNVPDEVFVGRNREQVQLESPVGSMFVYGGRQLGKSALLRKIERDFSSTPDQHAIYIDLSSKGLGINGWEEPRKLWQIIYRELAVLGIVKQNTVRNPEPVVTAIEGWLDGKHTRRLLLLLDEADVFLDKESASGFRNVGPLKGLFDGTGGRFKPVFAGLHKVQRLQGVANTPLAHGGQDILIGPLSGTAARNLVITPMRALGYEFEDPNLVWRLLAYTNLQAGLIQIVCLDLIKHLQSRPLLTGEPLVQITSRDIETVIQNPDTRAQIASRLGMTMKLEDRYHVIALVMAVMGMESDFRDVHSAIDIRESCEMYWAEGFEKMNSAEFGIYLSEMEGLGVLSGDGTGNYSMRSPNIVTMLGTKDELEAALDENAFQLTDELKPKSTRREIAGSGGARSPLTEYQLSELVPNADRFPALNFLVVGSTAFDIGNAIPVLKEVAADREVDATVLDATAPDAIGQLMQTKLAVAGTGRPRMLIVDATTASVSRSTELATAVMKLRRRAGGHLVLIFGPDGIDAVNTLADRKSVVPTRVLELSKWSSDGIRSWQDNPFSPPDLRDRLIDTTGGWPQLVDEAAAAAVTVGATQELQRLEQYPATPDEAQRFLDSAGVSPEVVARLIQWNEVAEDTFEPVIDLGEVLGVDHESMRRQVETLVMLGIVEESKGRYRVDRLITRALKRVSNK